MFFCEFHKNLEPDIGFTSLILFCTMSLQFVLGVVLATEAAASTAVSCKNL